MSPPPGTKVYLACKPADMRKGFNGLSAEVVEVLKSDPYAGHLFVFRGKRGDMMKILYWDGTGLCLFSKRLEHGSFVWPSTASDRVQMTAAQLALLIEGIDWKRTHLPHARYALPDARKNPVFA
ncbi:MAG TPA: IS66 family insertion sequence element accessory protein TnpB [Bryobacteraceae bacterium]|nr:IS66 family insertion sequence element accessory protein TnpB [Bryobacteraceae bacterium]